MSEIDNTPEVDETVEDSTIDDGIEVEYSADTLAYFVKNRKEELGLNEPEPTEETIEETTPPESEPSETASNEPDEAVERFKTLLEEEKRQREERKQLETEQRALAKEREELELFRKAKDKFSEDPEALLKAMGLDDNGIQEFAKYVIYRSLGEDAPDDFKRTLKDKRLENEIARLREELEEKTKPPEVNPAEEFRKQYVGSLQKSASSVDADQYPLVAKFAETKGVDEVVTAMFGYAQKNAIEMNGEGDALTPEECIQRFEKDLQELGKLYGNASPPAEKKKQVKKTLRNQTIQAPEKDISKLSPEEQNKIFRERFYERLGLK